MHLIFEENPDFYNYYIENVYRPSLGSNLMWDYFFQSNKDWDSTVLCCMPTKTGNYTVFNGGIKYCPPNILFADTWHSSCHLKEFFLMSNIPTKKIVTAVREPISQNLSLVFQAAGHPLFVDQPAFWRGDFDGLLQKIFEIECKKDSDSCMYSKYMEYNQSTLMIQNFFEEQFENRLGICLYDYPFDKEAGYSVISVDGFEIFVFQIEKLNIIYKELFQFIGLESDACLENMNVGDEKWYNYLYSETKETITFSEEYYKWCYQAPYFHHFYSDEDIKKFELKWQGHIR